MNKTSTLNQNKIKQLKERYERMKAWGLLTSLDLHNCNLATMKSKSKIKSYVKELCKLIDMKRFGETVVIRFGSEPRVAGFSMMQLIETSLISGHFADESRNVYIDIFSCKFYDPYAAAEFTKKFFGAKDYKITITFRK